MTAGNLLFRAQRSRDWCDLYKAALFETDKQRLPRRTTEAERVLVLRAQRLFSLSGSNTEEEQAIDDALYALRSLRTCYELKCEESVAA